MPRHHRIRPLAPFAFPSPLPHPLKMGVVLCAVVVHCALKYEEKVYDLLESPGHTQHKG